MNAIQIREPIWKTPRSVGLNLDTLRQAYARGEKSVPIEILYEKTKGEREYPLVMFFFLDPDKINAYKHTIRKGTELIEVPIFDLSYSAMTEKNPF